MSYQLTHADPTGTHLVALPLTTSDTAPPVLLQDRQVRQIPMPMPVRDASTAAVNPSGTVVGSAVGTDGSRFGWVYRNGNTTMLAVPPGFDWAGPAAVNARGDIVGTAVRYSRQGTIIRYEGETAVLWRAEAPDRPKLLDHPAEYPLSDVSGITDDGTVVGRAFGGARPAAPAAWRPDGTIAILSLPAGLAWGRVTGARSGWAYGVAGHSDDEAARATPVAMLRWDLRTGDAVSIIAQQGTLRLEPIGVTDDGWLLARDAIARTVAMVGPDGTVHRLPAEPGTKGTYADAVSVSPDGRTITGQASFPGVASRIARWTC